MSFQQSALLVIPAFILLIGIEYVFGKLKNHNVYHNLPDAISSLSSGMANIIMAAIGIGVGLVSYDWMLTNFAIFKFDYHSPLVWVMVIIGLDFGGYWGHRLSHQFNLFWQTHVVHHSSEEFNLPCALRQTSSGKLISFFTILGTPLAILGIPMEIIAVVSLAHLYYQFWYHTQLIGKLGWLERIIVTPQQHGIHHAMNPEYIDKNFGQWFSIWDQLFGTYQLEIDGVKPVYGVTRPVQTWNPIKIDFMLWGLMLRDMFETKKLKDKLHVLFSKTNWRPEDTMQNNPVFKIQNVNNFKKFQPHISKLGLTLGFSELIVALSLLVIYFLQLTTLSDSQNYLFGGFLLLNIFTFTTALEGKTPISLLAIRLIFFCTCMFVIPQGFGPSEITPALSIAYAIFFGMALLYAANQRKNPVHISETKNTETLST